jgi:hypothetical protein
MFKFRTPCHQRHHRWKSCGVGLCPGVLYAEATGREIDELRQEQKVT